MSQENPTSETTKPQYKIYQTMDEAVKAIETTELHDTCRVINEGFQFFILVDDLDGHKFWHPYDGVHKDEAIRINLAFKAGQKKYRENPLTATDVEALRNIMTAVATLAQLFEYDENAILTISDSAIVKFAFDLYKRDEKKPAELKLKDMDPKDPVLGSYVTKVTFVFHEYSELIAKLQASVDEATNEASKLPAEGEGNGVVNEPVPAEQQS